MSFILDALKKLEREKQAREPDVVVVGPVAWGGADRRGGRRWFVLSGVAVAVIAGGTAWWLASWSGAGAGAGSRPVPAAPPVTASSPAAREAPSPVPAATPSSAPRARTTTEPPPPRRLGLPGAEAVTPPAEGPAVGVAVGVTQEGSARLEDPPVVTEAVPPTQPLARDPEDVDFRLSAISMRDGQPVALLNDRLVREGDAFEGVRILRIGTIDIEIEVDGERRTIGF